MKFHDVFFLSFVCLNYDLFLQEMVYFMPNLLKNTEPLLKMNWNETSVHFPFDGFTKEKFPDVSNCISKHFFSRNILGKFCEKVIGLC